MSNTFEFLYLNKRRKTIQQVLAEHGINNLKTFGLFLKEQSLSASQQTLKEVDALTTEIISPNIDKLEEPEEVKPKQRKPLRRSSSNNQQQDDEDIQSPSDTNQSQPTLPETN